MKKVLYLILLTLLICVNKVKAWCVLCYHPVHGAAEQLIEEDKHNLTLEPFDKSKDQILSHVSHYSSVR